MNHLEHHRDLGPADRFPATREAIFTWQLQELAGVAVRPGRRVAEGQVVDLLLNPLWPTSPRRLRGRDLLVTVGSCIVSEVIDEADRAGFTRSEEHTSELQCPFDGMSDRHRLPTPTCSERSFS